MSANPAEGPELVRLFLKQFQLCDLKKGESVVLLSNAETDRVRVQAAFVAAEMMEAMAFEFARAYQQHGNWDFIRNNREAWERLKD